MRVGFLGPEGTFSEEALLATAPDGADPVALATIHECVLAVQEGRLARAVVPIENALEGSVNVTLDALVQDAPGVAIVGEVVRPIRFCLAAAGGVELAAVELVASHPQAHAQCARFVRSRLPGARALATSSTAEAVRTVVGEPGRPWAALAPRLAADLYGATVLCEHVEDDPGNVTRFVWLAPSGEAWRLGNARVDVEWKTSLVFWGAGASEPGWLVRCLSELAFRGVNLVRIESRPSREGLGRYRFFLDLSGRADDDRVAAGVEALRRRCEGVRVLGSYPAAT